MNPNQPGTRRSFLKGALATPLLLVGPAALAHAKSAPRGHRRRSQHDFATIPGAEYHWCQDRIHPDRRRFSPRLPDGRDPRRTRRLHQWAQPIHPAHESRDHNRRTGHRARARQQRRLCLALDHQHRNAEGREGPGPHPSGRQSIPVGCQRQQVRRRHHAVAAALLRRSCGGECLFGPWTGNARSYPPQR